MLLSQDQHIVRKLAGENSGFAVKFFLRLNASFFCSSCVGGPYSDAHPTTELHCSEPARMIHSAKILNLPLILCFGVKNTNVRDAMKIPEQITLTVDDENVSYRRLDSSVWFDTYKNEELKFDYGNFYHPRVDGDTKTGAHTYLHFRTDNVLQEKLNEFLPTYDPETVRENPLNKFNKMLCETETNLSSEILVQNK
uniref:Uncharacterized protein n=1 Tax=Tetranychus urticae TaxID=32264 RepID=T1JQ92_TETUR